MDRGILAGQYILWTGAEEYLVQSQTDWGNTRVGIDRQANTWAGVDRQGIKGQYQTSSGILGLS